MVTTSLWDFPSFLQVTRGTFSTKNSSTMALSAVALPELTSPQLDNILSRLQIQVPSEYDYSEEQKLQLIHCSKVFNKHLSGFNDTDIFAVFSDKNRFVDFQVEDEVNGIFPTAGKKKKQYPCIVCAGEVTKLDNDTGYGLECSGCGHYFHNSCNEKPLSIELFAALKNSSEFVKVYCPECNYLSANINHNVKLLRGQVSKLTANVEEMAASMKSMKPWSGVASNPRANAASTSAQNNTNQRILKVLSHQNKDQIDKERNARNAKTVIVRKPMSKNLSNSKDNRTELKKAFPGVAIEDCLTTPGGSLKFVFDTPETAATVKAAWVADDTKEEKMKLFGGNDGLVQPDSQLSTGIAKYVDVDCTEQQLKDEIGSKYPDVTECDPFKNKKGELTGTVKLTFKTVADRDTVIRDNLKIFNECFVVEEFKSKPRVIICNRCQRFGHIQRLCRSKTIKCGKCSSMDHESRDCTSNKLKCAHCGRAHATGHKDCVEFKKKLDTIRERSYYG